MWVSLVNNGVNWLSGPPSVSKGTVVLTPPVGLGVLSFVFAEKIKGMIVRASTSVSTEKESTVPL